jgi:hypothetical protein
MKKIYKSALFALLANAAIGQSQFFTPTTYRGAFAPGVAQWTDAWTNFNPQKKEYNPLNKAVVQVTANITANTTWSSSKVYLLKGQIFVTGNATLTIPAGTVIMGDKASQGACLVITRGSKLIANGTKTSPIVFTSNQAIDARAKGDWGGIVILGKATNNQAGGQAFIEGYANAPLTQHGGSDDTDNSGSLKFVRIEYCGFAYQPNQEINGLTMGSVGSGTTIENIQVSYCNDDAFEWFGGTVNAKYLVSYKNLDDDFDTDFGYRGNVQFGLVYRDPAVADNPSVSTSEGFESDNDGSGTTATPKTAARFSNITLVGPLKGNPAASVEAGYRRGARLRRHTELKIYNSIFMDFKNGLHIDASTTEGNATAGTLIFKNNILAGRATTGKFGEVNSGSTFNINSFLLSNKNDTITSSANILTNPYNELSFDFRPSVGSVASKGSDFVDASITSLVKTIATTQLNANVCNGSVAALNTAIYGIPVTGAVGYKFRVSLNGNLVKDTVRSSYSFALSMIPTVAYNTTYQVQVAPIYGGVVQPFAYTCTVTTPIASTSIKNAHCDANLTTMASGVYANAILKAQSYKYFIQEGNHVDSLISTSSAFSFSKFLNPLSRKYATTYSVKAAVKTADVWSVYSLACDITTPALPTAAIATASCNATVNLVAYVNADAFIGATKFKFILTNGAHTDSVIQTSRSLKMGSFKNALSKVNGTTYSLKVAAEYNGVFGNFSSPCNITLNTAGLIANDNNTNGDVVSYPNPFTSNFKLAFDTNSNSDVKVVISDLTGKVIESKVVSSSDFQNITFGENAHPGMYSVSVQQDGVISNFKVVKSNN